MQTDDSKPFLQPIPQDSSEHEAKKEYFQKRLHSILERELTPETIENYAHDALEDTVGLVEDAKHSYGLNTNHHFGRAEEDTAITYFGLLGIDEILDHIASMQESIKDIDNVIKNATLDTEVITPPDYEEMRIIPGAGTFKDKKIIQRTKTALFLLEQDFEVDIKDPESIDIKRGIIADGMMRKTSYFLIDVPELERIILTCDEEGNASFVFDRSKVSDRELTSEDIAHMTKEELNDLIKFDPEIGRRIVYSKYFIDNLRRSIDDPVTISDFEEEGHQDDADSNKYLKLSSKAEKAPEGYLSSYGIESLLASDEYKDTNAYKAAEGTIQSTINRILETNAEQFGEVRVYRSNGGNKSATKFYSPEQVDMIIKEIPPLPPEGYLSSRGIANAYKTSSPVVHSAIDRILETDAEQFGEVGVYRTIGGKTQFYSPEQVDMIIKEIPPLPPEGYLSSYGIENAYKVARDTIHSTINRILETNAEQFGEVGVYRTKGGTRECYSPEQVDMIIKEIGKLHPEGYLSLYGIESLLASDEYKDKNEYKAGRKAIISTIDRILETNAEQFGEVGVYRTIGGKTQFYSPEQVDMIIKEIIKRRAEQ